MMNCELCGSSSRDLICSDCYGNLGDLSDKAQGDIVSFFDGLNRCKDERLEKLESILHEAREVLLSGRAGANVDHALNVLGKLIEEEDG